MPSRPSAPSARHTQVTCREPGRHAECGQPVPAFPIAGSAVSSLLPSQGLTMGAVAAVDRATKSSRSRRMPLRPRSGFDRASGVSVRVSTLR
jgi:hypothetical protein